MWKRIAPRRARVDSTRTAAETRLLGTAVEGRGGCGEEASAHRIVVGGPYLWTASCTACGSGWSERAAARLAYVYRRTARRRQPRYVDEPRTSRVGHRRDERVRNCLPGVHERDGDGRAV